MNEIDIDIDLEHFLLNCKVEARRLDQFIKDEENNLFPKRDVFFELRQAAEDYFSHKSSARMFGLSGLRGIGKTTIMWQLAKDIFDNYTQDIYFFNVEAFVQLFGATKLYLIFYKFEEIVLKKKFYELDKPIVFLFDEVHDAENWSKGLKILYDECPRSFIISTGSSALLLDSSTDLVTRWNVFHIFPYKYSEFIQIRSWKKWNVYAKNLAWILDLQKRKKNELKRKTNQETLLNMVNKSIDDYKSHIKEINKKNKKNLNEIKNNFSCKDIANGLMKILFFSRDIEELKFELEKIKSEITLFFSKKKDPYNIDEGELLFQYINYHNIPRFLTIENTEQIYERASEMFEKILQIDVPKWYKVSNVESIISNVRKLLIRLAFSKEVQIEKLCSDTGCKKEEVELLITVLKKSEVLNEFKYFGNINSKLNKISKTFFMSPTLRLSLREKYERHDITPTLQGILNEEIVAMYLKRLFSEGDVSFMFSTKKEKKNVDFVIETRKQTDDKVILLEVKSGKKDISQISQSEVQYRYGILVCTEAKDYSIIDNTLVIPLSWFLLL